LTNTILAYLFSVLPILSAPIVTHSKWASDTGSPPSLHSTSYAGLSAVATSALTFLAIDSDGSPVTDLKAEELRLRVNKTDRKILSLSSAREAPKTIGLFFDISGSRRADRQIGKEIQAAENFLQSTWHQGDEGFVSAFGDKLYFVARPTKDLSQILASLGKISDATYYGPTALFDALCGVQIKKTGAEVYEIAFVVLSDFGDNSSKQKEDAAVKFLIKEGVRVFPVFLGESFGSNESKMTRKRSMDAAREMAEHTGGQVLTPESEPDLAGAFQQITNAFHATYSAQYESPQQGDSHKKIQLDTSRPHVKLLYARE
jgi:VWFA-related protein